MPYDKGGGTMKEFTVFIHQPNDPLVKRVEVVRARSRRQAMKKLQKMGLKKRKF